VNLPADTQPAVPPAESFGVWLARRRRDLGLSQAELAQRLCTAGGRATFTRHEVARYERGIRLPTGFTVSVIAAGLGLPVDVVRMAAAAERRRRAHPQQPAHHQSP
jgi:transcriptional regulator with XRE-family HTH domain